MLNKLLRQNISYPQMAGYALAALVGMSIIFTAFCFSMDVRPLFASGEGLFKPEYMVLNKTIPLSATFKSRQTVFSQEEIAEIGSQSFVRSVASFTPSRFQVSAYTEISSDIPSLSTDLFFESVPDRLLGKVGRDWKWDIQSDLIPIIIPRDYLNLYNFGFAGSQGLPQVSEGIVQQVLFQVVISGSGKQGVFKGRIAGFSDELNTILVPEAFMEWANKEYGHGGAANNISRLIVEVDNPAAPEIASFFAENPQYVVNDSKANQGKLSYFLTLLIAIVLLIGSIILVLAIGLMLLSINLLVYKNKKTLGNLVLLGYRRGKLAQAYCVLTLVLNVAVAFISILLAQYARSLYAPRLEALGIHGTAVGFSLTLAFATTFMLLITGLDIFWIHRKIRHIDIPQKG